MTLEGDNWKESVDCVELAIECLVHRLAVILGSLVLCCVLNGLLLGNNV